LFCCARRPNSSTAFPARRLAAHAKHAKYDSKEQTEAARKGFAQRFIDQVDPDRQLPERERQRRAEHAMRAHMTRLALQSSKVRKARRK
jgi:hypothetical protein